MPGYRYKILDPSGNVTALVIGLVHDADARRAIQDAILAKHPDVEQVGFVNAAFGAPQLFMTGGEFCGNAARAAAWHYLDGMRGEIQIWVSGAGEEIRAGVNKAGMAWTSAPVRSDLMGNVRRIVEGIYFVKMDGMCHFVVAQRQSEEYLKGLDADSEEDKERLKDAARKLMDRHGLGERPACGVVFCESVLDMVKIHPCVFINSAGTAFYEMACGSGSVAVGLASAYLRGQSVALPVLQPSDKVIDMSITVEGGRVLGAVISGEVAGSGEILEVEVHA